MSQPETHLPASGAETTPGEEKGTDETTIRMEPNAPEKKNPLERYYRAGGCLPDQTSGATPPHFGH